MKEIVIHERVMVMVVVVGMVVKGVMVMVVGIKDLIGAQTMVKHHLGLCVVIKSLYGGVIRRLMLMWDPNDT